MRVPDDVWTLRPCLREDYGWIVRCHGELYRREHGWDERFESLVAGIVADIARDLDPERERGWIAELDGHPVGSVFLVRHPEREGVAKLRLLLVEPEARGLGIGARLVAECTAFARQAGYRAITLWTSSVLHAARRLYEAEGYRLVREEPEDLFNEGELAQEWELPL
jgi:GNAT superfamily N-acetyltransferase